MVPSGFTLNTRGHVQKLTLYYSDMLAFIVLGMFRTAFVCVVVLPNTWDAPLVYLSSAYPTHSFRSAGLDTAFQPLDGVIFPVQRLKDAGYIKPLL